MSNVERFKPRGNWIIVSYLYPFFAGTGENVYNAALNGIKMIKVLFSPLVINVMLLYWI